MRRPPKDPDRGWRSLGGISAYLKFIKIFDIIFISKERKYIMASENKKRKAKNSYLHNGADKMDGKHKRIMYFTKRERQKNKLFEK